MVIDVGGLRAGTRTVVMGVDGVIVCGGGMCPGGVDHTMYKAVATAPEDSNCAPLQIRLHQQRPGA